MTLGLDLADAYVREQQRQAAGEEFKYANLVILRCVVATPADETAELVDPTGDWVPVLPSHVPEWLQDPEHIGRMVKGQMVGCRGKTPDINDPHGEVACWYRAERLPMRDESPRYEPRKLRAPHAPKIIQAGEIVSVDESKPDGVKPA